MKRSAIWAFSIFWYLSLTPCNALLTKYIGLWFLSISWTKAELMELSMITRYMNKGMPNTNQLSMGGVAKNSFNFWKASSHSLVHQNLLFFFRLWKKGNTFSANFERNWDMIIIFPVNYRTSFMLVGLFTSIIALHFSGLELYEFNSKRTFFWI